MNGATARVRVCVCAIPRSYLVGARILQDKSRGTQRAAQFQLFLFFVFFAVRVDVSVSHRPRTSLPRAAAVHCTPAAALQGLSFASATNGVSVSCPCVHVPSWTHSGRFQPTVPVPLNLKGTRAVRAQPNSSPRTTATNLA